MTFSAHHIIRFFAIGVLALLAGACTATAGGPTSAAATESAAAAPAAAPQSEVVEPAAAPETPVDADTVAEAEPIVETQATDETEAAPEVAGGGTINIVFEDGRSWSLPTSDCYTDPDSAFGVFFMSGVDGSVDLDIVESWPLDGDRSNGTAFIGAFWDETGTYYTIEGGPVTDVGGELSFTSDVYAGISGDNRFSATFSCTP